VVRVGPTGGEDPQREVGGRMGVGEGRRGDQVRRVDPRPGREVKDVLPTGVAAGEARETGRSVQPSLQPFHPTPCVSWEPAPAVLAGSVPLHRRQRR
jgi:hypothetical protein